MTTFTGVVYAVPRTDANGNVVFQLRPDGHTQAIEFLLPQASKQQFIIPINVNERYTLTGVSDQAKASFRVTSISKAVR